MSESRWAEAARKAADRIPDAFIETLRNHREEKSMSTNDVPGANPANGDELKMGCWAEHSDGSLIFVENTEANRIIYSVFDVSKDPVVEYRDAMPKVNFERQFSWKADITNAERWTWHDKTQFPWDRVIARGARDGLRFASADGLHTAAERVADRLRLRGREYDERRESRRETSIGVSGILGKLHAALDELGDALNERH